MIPANQLTLRNSCFTDLSDTWDMIDSLYGGTQTMRDAGQTYLPKATNETDTDYTARLKSSVLFNFYKQAVDSTTDLVFNNGIDIANSTTTLDEFFSNVDAKGDDLESFMREAAKSAVHYGISYLVADFTATDPNQVQDFDRPYWILVEAPNMIAVESRRVNGVETIVHIRFQETTTNVYSVPDSPLAAANYTSTLVQQVRSYYLVEVDGKLQVQYEIYQQVKNEWVRTAAGIQAGVDRIPFVPLYGNKNGYFIGRPVYQDVAELNVRHWQSYSDQSNLLHYARFPILFASGIDSRDANGKPVQIEIGANTVLRTDNPNAELKFVEHTGKAVDAGWDDIDRLEETMSVFGPSVSISNTGGSTTATEWVIRASALNSTLYSLADQIEAAFTQLLAFTVPYLNEPSFPTLTLNPRVLNIPETTSNPAGSTVNSVSTSGTQALANAAAASGNQQ